MTVGWDDAGEGTPDRPVAQVIAAATLADLGRRVVGAAPFPQELDGARVAAVMAAAGVTLDPRLQRPRNGPRTAARRRQPARARGRARARGERPRHRVAHPGRGGPLRRQRPPPQPSRVADARRVRRAGDSHVVAHHRGADQQRVARRRADPRARRTAAGGRQQRDHTGQSSSEITGPAFNPVGNRLYLSSQRGTSGSSSGGITDEITGPFRSAGRKQY